MPEPQHLDTQPASKKKQQKRGVLGFISEVLIIVALSLGLSLFILNYIGYPYWIPSASMMETLQVGDNVFGEKITYRTSSPKAGDIVTFTNPENPDETLIKRVIATEGQTVELIAGDVYVDGIALSEPYTGGKQSYELNRHSKTRSSNISYPYTVPKGCVWVMGDNRSNSLDSRYFGAIEISTISSKALFIYWPPNHIRSL